jgi:hypothetical protein
MGHFKKNNNMGIFDKISNANPLFREFAKKLVSEIEREFNTRVFDYGILVKGEPDFDPLIPFMVSPPPNTKYIFYFLIPIDDADNIITNDYYEKSQKANEGGFLGFGGYEFSSILRSDWDLTNFLQSKVQSTVYDFGSYKVDEYKGSENTVSNVENIEDLRYRFFRFFAGD